MTTDPEPSKGERTQAAILEAARALFLAQGYTATGMRQIARAVGITPAAIYNHFSGKEEIFSTLLHRAAPTEQLAALFDSASGDTVETVLPPMVRGIVELITSHEEYVRLAMLDAQERDGAALVTLLPGLFPHAMAFYQRLVALDRAEGRLRDLSPFVFMRTLISFTFGYLITEHVVHPATTFHLPEEDWVHGLVDIFLHGVLKPPLPGEESSNGHHGAS